MANDICVIKWLCVIRVYEIATWTEKDGWKIKKWKLKIALKKNFNKYRTCSWDKPLSLPKNFLRHILDYASEAWILSEEGSETSKQIRE